jgi:cytochrome c-type biogenesis protein CcmF
MPALGTFLTFLAFVCSLLAMGALAWGIRQQDEKLLNVGRRSLHSVFFLIAGASAVLIYLLVTRDFSVKYVASYTSRDLPLVYTLVAFWAGHAGSLLFWQLVLAFYTVIVLRRYPENDGYTPVVAAVLAGVSTFFTLVLSFVSSPFETLDFVPQDGAGLNPMLQNMGMLLHPVTQYLGYVGFTIPYAFAMAALLLRRADDEWIRKTRTWTIISWMFLTAGIVWGGQWAYVELGWGGYWAWDPVENASFFPWLTATAFLHSVMIQERKGMLKVWNVSLIALTFFFVVFGTFLVRSGVLASVHDFAEGAVGRYFLAFLTLIALGSAYLILDRAPQLRGEGAFEGLLAKESSFLVNNVLFLGLTFATFWGTIFPILSEAITGERVTVGPPFFNQVTAPLFLGMLVLMGICPLIAWRRASAERLLRSLILPAAVGLLGLGAALVLTGRVGVAFAYAASLFIVAGILYDWFQEARVRRGYHPEEGLLRAAWRMMRIRPRKYGGYIVHLGVALMAIGIVASTAFKEETVLTLRPGETARFAGFELRYEGLEVEPQGDQTVVSATLLVYRDGRKGEACCVGSLYDRFHPAKVFHGEEQPHSEVAIAQAGLFDDLYAILAGFEEGGSEGGYATFKMLYHPLVNLIWLGFYVMLVGGGFALWGGLRPRRRPVPGPAVERLTAPQRQEEPVGAKGE